LSAKKFEKKTGAKVVKAQIKSQPTSSSTTNVVQTKKVKEDPR